MCPSISSTRLPTGFLPCAGAGAESDLFCIDLFCIDRYQLIFEKHCKESGSADSARNGSNQRLQAMSDTVLVAITQWLAENHNATQEVKTRLDLGYLTYMVLLLVIWLA
jgi:hypothetical protein